MIAYISVNITVFCVMCVCVCVDPDVPTEPMLPEDFGKFRKSHIPHIDIMVLLKRGGGSVMH